MVAPTHTVDVDELAAAVGRELTVTTTSSVSVHPLLPVAVTVYVVVLV